MRKKLYKYNLCIEYTKDGEKEEVERRIQRV